MLEEEFQRPANKSKLFSIVGVSFLVLLLGAALLIWRLQEAGSINNADPSYNGAYSSVSSEYEGCGGDSCGSSSSSDGSCCGSGQSTQNMTSEEIDNFLKEAEKAGLSYYAETYGDNSVSAKATDYGCHTQVDIYQGDQIVKSLGYDAENGIYQID